MHGRAFDAYVRAGEEDAMRGLDLEGKSLSTAVAADGGYLVDPQTSETVKTVLESTASIRAVATVVNVEATSYDVLVDHGELGSGLVERDRRRWSTETGTPQVDRISIALHELSALPKASQRLLDDAAFDIEGWLARSHRRALRHRGGRRPSSTATASTSRAASSSTRRPRTATRWPGARSAGSIPALPAGIGSTCRQDRRSGLCAGRAATAPTARS